jgi:hypothetical protein
LNPGRRGPELAWWNALNERIPQAEVITLFQKRDRDALQSDAVYSSIDPMRDKISKFEIGSLTPSELRQLNRERERLLKKS